MCPSCDDFARTVMLLGALTLYAERCDADPVFADLVGGALAASLPEPPAGLIPPDCDPGEGPEYPTEG
ncbi:hypothetical protein [Streptomyces sp. TRM68416]|uniref:hypothetical protein n=1 Tax=Streptomyces sp. TRM68416 TaxID=2758412 RepID=UPI001661EE86|nr:hypothetical protein [Streptomyces sp. TRM68416]MBD0843269.1 hypothetical protein [Streptomyces sp. TRM68416]